MIYECARTPIREGDGKEECSAGKEISPILYHLRIAPRVSLRSRGLQLWLIRLRRRQQALQLLGILDVELETAGHHDVAGLLVGLAGADPFGFDGGRGVERL